MKSEPVEKPLLPQHDPWTWPMPRLARIAVLAFLAVAMAVTVASSAGPVETLLLLAIGLLIVRPVGRPGLGESTDQGALRAEIRKWRGEL